MASDVALFLQSLDYGEAEIGMVDFAEYARVLEPIIPLDSDGNLNQLLNAIPTTTNGYTCIGCGLKKGLEVFQFDAILVTTVFGIYTTFTIHLEFEMLRFARTRMKTGIHFCEKKFLHPSNVTF